MKKNLTESLLLLLFVTSFIGCKKHRELIDGTAAPAANAPQSPAPSATPDPTPIHLTVTVTRAGSVVQTLNDPLLVTIKAGDSLEVLASTPASAFEWALTNGIATYKGLTKLGATMTWQTDATCVLDQSAPHPDFITGRESSGTIRRKMAITVTP